MKKPVTFTAPQSGFYQVSAHVTTYKKTGKKIVIENPEAKWWAPWRPFYIEVDEYVADGSHKGLETKFFAKGEQIEATFLQRLP